MGIFQAENSGKEFPVALDHVWRIGYSSKEAAVKMLKKKFDQSVDYQVSTQLDENPLGGRPTNIYFLNVSCLEYLIVRGNREVFEVYRACRKALYALVNPIVPIPALPTTFKQALQALLGEVEKNEVLEVELAQAAPKVLFFDNVATSINAISMAQAAKVLKIPDVGRTKLFQLLRDDNILQSDNTPYQTQIDQGHFEIQLQTFPTVHGERVTTTTRVTGKGLEWMTYRYKQAA